MATWTAEVLSVVPGHNDFAAEVRLLSDAGDKQHTVLRARGNEDLKAQIRSLIGQATQVKAGPIAVGLLDITIKPPVVVPPTQEELDLRAFSVLVSDYRRIDAKFKLPDGITTALDLSNLRAAIKAAYKPAPEYDQLIVGVF